MFGINGKPILDVGELIDQEIFPVLHREVVLALTRLQTYPSPGYEFSRGHTHPDLYDRSLKDVGQAEAEWTEDERKLVEGLSYVERCRYTTFANGAYYPWWICYPLKGSMPWMQKMEAGWPFTSEALENFPRLIEYVQGLPFFSSIGRVIILGLLPLQLAPCHRDADPGTYPMNDEFIMICPGGRKRFYVYEPETRTKHYASSRAYMFHDLDYHGADPSPAFTYSIRIDGIFKPEFRERIDFGRAPPRGETGGHPIKD